MIGARLEPDMPFEGGPPHRFQTWVGLIKAGRPQTVRRAVIASLVAWVPVALLSALRGDLYRSDHANAFLLDFGAYARFLIAPALLILAESLSVPRLAAIARQFLKGGLISDADRALYDYAVGSTQRLMKSQVADVASIVLPYLLVGGLLLASPPTGEVPGWHGVAHGNGFSLSPAGWWALLISSPLLLMLLLGWVWRLILWTRFLWLMNGIELQLVPAHPDRAGGLRFVGTSLVPFMPLGLIIGVIVAGPVANRVFHFGASPTDFNFMAGGTLAFVILIFAGPLLVFTRRLMHEQFRGMFRYGALSQGLGQQFERRWLTQRQVDKSALEVSDFSATTDLYSIVANVYAMRIVPLQLKYVVLLALATLLPFIPVALLSVPVSVIVKKLAGLLL